jgi:hypothetical protein
VSNDKLRSSIANQGVLAAAEIKVAGECIDGAKIKYQRAQFQRGIGFFPIREWERV